MTAAGPADFAAIAAISDPAERAVAMRRYVAVKNTLSAAESAAYRATIRELKGDGERCRKWIAQLLGLTPGAVNRLLGPKTTQTAAQEAS